MNSKTTNIEIPKPPDKSKDDQRIGYIVRKAYEQYHESFRYDEVELTLRLNRQFEKSVNKKDVE